MAQIEWFSSKGRIDFILKYKYKYDMCYDQDANIAHILQNQTFVTIIGNTLMLKEYNKIELKGLLNHFKQNISK